MTYKKGMETGPFQVNRFKNEKKSFLMEGMKCKIRRSGKQKEKIPARE